VPARCSGAHAPPAVQAASGTRSARRGAVVTIIRPSRLREGGAGRLRTSLPSSAARGRPPSNARCRHGPDQLRDLAPRLEAHPFDPVRAGVETRHPDLEVGEVPLPRPRVRVGSRGGGSSTHSQHAAGGSWSRRFRPQTGFVSFDFFPVNRRAPSVSSSCEQSQYRSRTGVATSTPCRQWRSTASAGSRYMTASWGFHERRGDRGGPPPTPPRPFRRHAGCACCPPRRRSPGAQVITQREAGEQPAAAGATPARLEVRTQYPRLAKCRARLIWFSPHAEERPVGATMAKLYSVPSDSFHASRPRPPPPRATQVAPNHNIYVIHRLDGRLIGAPAHRRPVRPVSRSASPAPRQTPSACPFDVRCAQQGPRKPTSMKPADAALVQHELVRSAVARGHPFIAYCPRPNWNSDGTLRMCRVRQDSIRAPRRPLLTQ